MSVAVTAVVKIDLHNQKFPPGRDEGFYKKDAEQHENDIKKLKNIIQSNGSLKSATIAAESHVMVVLPIPEKQVAFAEIVHLCSVAKFPYETLWLSDQGVWKKGVHTPCEDISQTS